MALEVASNILLNVKANTKDAKRKLKDLSKEEQKAAKQFIEGQERRNESIDKQIALLGKVAVGVGALAGGFVVLSRAAETYSQAQRLATAGASKNIDALREASRGLVDDTALLTLAANASTGAYKLTQRELEGVTTSIIKLRGRGHDLQELLQDFGKFLREGTVSDLEKYGIAVDTSGSKTEQFRKGISALQKQVLLTNEALDNQGDEVDRARVQWSNAIRDLTLQLGKLAVALTPVVEMAALLAEQTGDFFDLLFGPSPLERLQAKLQREELLKQRRDLRLEFPGRFDPDDFLDRFQKEWIKAGEALAKSKTKDDPPKRQKVEELIVDKFDVSKAQLFTVGEGSIGSEQTPGLGGAQLKFDVLEQFIEMNEELAKAAERAAEETRKLQEQAANTEGQRALLAMAEGVDTVALSIDLATSAMGTFQAIGTEAFAAWIDGSKSFGDALEDAGKRAVASIAMQMAGEALRHGAQAIGATAIAFGMLATGNPGAAPMFKSAGEHALAAAAFGAGAAALGSIAKTFAVNQAESGGRGGLPAAAVGAGGGAGGGGQSSQTFIVVQDQFDDDPRAARRRLKKAFDRAQGEYRGRPAVVRA